MKKIFLFSITILIVWVMGCKKDTTTGPTGPSGPAGPTGPGTILAIDTFSVPISSWVITSPGFYKYVRVNTMITQQVVDAGTISVFARNSTHPDWYAMPYTVAGNGGAGQRFSYNLNTLTLYSENYTSGIPYVYQFKVVISK